jgi:enoyl-CoA hydratase/carnithine racemase
MSDPADSDSIGEGPIGGGEGPIGGGEGRVAPVRYERRGAAAVITIDRQHKRNAVDGPTASALHEAYTRFEANEDARVLVLTGAGGVSFCAGADLKAIDTFAERLTAAEGPLGFTRLTPSKPTIAAISGFCLAGGLELALWCDLRIATEDSKLGYPERRWGVPLIDGGTQRLPRLVGLGRALDMILTGRMVGAAEALSMGLITEIVPAGAALERALALAQGLAQFPQRTMLADRRAAIEGLGMTLAEGLALEAKAGPEVFEDGARGAARFAGGEGRGGAGTGA